MPFIGGVKNTNKRARPSPASSTNDSSESATSSSHRPHPTRRRTNAPTINRTVDQSLFGDKHKAINLKQQIRSIHRLLNNPHKQTTLDADTIQRKQTELRILNDQLVDKQRRDRLDRIDRKYKMVKFIERQKVVRRMRSLHRRLTSLTSTSRGATDEETAIRAEMERVQADQDYIDYYPRGTKYVALFASSKAEAEAKTTRGQRAVDGEDDDDEDSDSELVVGGKHSKPPQPKSALPVQRDSDEHKTDTDSGTAVTPPPTIDDSTRAADLEAQRAVIREAVKKAKAKATAGDKKAEEAASGESSVVKEKRRRETKDDFFVFEGQDNGGEEKKGDEEEDGNQEVDSAGLKEERDDRRGDMRERRQHGDSNRQQSRDGRDGARRHHGRDQSGEAEHSKQMGRQPYKREEAGSRDGRQSRNGREFGTRTQNGREQGREGKLSTHEERQPYQRQEARRTDNHSSDRRSLQPSKRPRDDEMDAGSRHNSVGQQRSAYNPNKHVRVSEVKKTARKIADVDAVNERTEVKDDEQRATEQNAAVDADTPAKRKRKRKHGRGDKAAAVAQEAVVESQQRTVAADADAVQPAGKAAKRGERKQLNGTGTRKPAKQSKAASEGQDEMGTEADERQTTKRQEAEIRDQRRQDVKSLLQLDDGPSDDE